MKKIIDKIVCIYRSNTLCQVLLPIILIILINLVWDLFDGHYSISSYIVWLVLIGVYLMYYVMTIKLKLRLRYQWLVSVIVLFSYFSISGYIDGGTADWTSYLIYFFISIGISGITILFPLGLKTVNVICNYWRDGLKRSVLWSVLLIKTMCI